jgi:hypothetical protein
MLAPADWVAGVLLLCLPVVLLAGAITLQPVHRPEVGAGTGFAVWVLVSGVYWVRRSRFHGRLWKQQYLICPGCDYDLSEVESSFCPECSQPFTREGVIRFWLTMEEKAMGRKKRYQRKPWWHSGST